MKIHLSKQFLVNTTINIVLLAFSVSSCRNIGKTEEEDAPKTPVKEEKDDPKTSLKDSKKDMNPKTPGEKTAEQQAKLLTKDNFQEVLGEAVVNKMAVNWSVFSDQEKSFDDPSKRREFKKIQDYLKKNITSLEASNNKAGKLYDKVIKLNDEMLQVHLERLKEIAATYFKNKFSEATIEFSPKSEGVQLGTKAIVTPKGEKPITYYLKTHSLGLASKNSSAAEILDPRELMGYKILEKLNIGCETYFLGRDLSNFYIATKDANSEGSFITYDKIFQLNHYSTQKMLLRILIRE